MRPENHLRWLQSKSDEALAREIQLRRGGRTNEDVAHEIELRHAKFDAEREARREAIRVAGEKYEEFHRRRLEVYFIQHGELDLIKIGYTARIGQRLRQLEWEYGNITLLGTIEGGRKDEKALHKMFFPFKAIPTKPKDEWFFPVNPILFFIEHFCHRVSVEVDSSG